MSFEIKFGRPFRNLDDFWNHIFHNFNIYIQFI